MKLGAAFSPLSADASWADLGHFQGQITKPRLAPRRPKVSIMLITYNHEKYIAQALESLLMQQTEYDYEINVVEDCSTDRTQDIVMQYVRKYPHIVKPHFNAKNIGYEVTQKNFYRGFFTLTGDYLAILEGDDYWSSPHKLQKQVAFLESNPDFAICACNTVKIYEDDSKESHRFLYYGQIDDGTVEDVINLRCFFHTTGIMYRNVFKGIPPRHYRNRWSCDIFIMISHAQFGKVRHLDEDMAVYRAHGAGRFSNMPLLDAWLFNIDGLRRYNRWLGYRHCKAFAQVISRYCRHVLGEAGKGGESEPLSWVQFVKLHGLHAVYGLLYQGLDLPREIRSVVRRSVRRYAARYAVARYSVARYAAARYAVAGYFFGLRKRPPPPPPPPLLPRLTKLAYLPPLPASAEWHLIWALNVKAIEGHRVVADQPILQLTAIFERNPRTLARHALCERLCGLMPRSLYRVTLWLKPGADANAHVQLRDSIVGLTGKPAHETDVWFNLSSQSVTKDDGDVVDSGIEAAADGWLKAWIDFVTANGQIYVYLGLVKAATGRHTFEGDGERLMFGGFEVDRVLPLRDLR